MTTIWNPNGTIEHIIDSCRMLAQREYTRRHNDVCGIIHQQITLNLGLPEDWKPYYRYVLVQVFENEHYLLYRDRPIQTDHLVVHNLPGIVLCGEKSWVDPLAQHVHYRRKLCARCLSSLLKITADFEPRYLGENNK